MESNFIGNNLNYLLQINTPTVSDPIGVDVFIITDTTSVTMHLRKKYILTIWKINGHIKECKKNGSYFYIIEGTEYESPIIYTQDFI